MKILAKASPSDNSKAVCLFVHNDPKAVCLFSHNVIDTLKQVFRH